MRTHGFTLIELVIVIAITGIIAAIVTVFLVPAINGYLMAQRLGTLSDMADTALRRMGRDIRSAVPNSIRWPNNQCFELVPTSTGGRYRMAQDNSDDADPLLISQPVSVFDVLSTLSVTPSVNDWVVIDNQNTDDVYTVSGSSGNDSAQITAVATPPADAGTMRLSISSTQFSSGYTGGRFVVVPNNGGNPVVDYVCAGTGITGGNGTGTLYRVTRGFVSAYPASCPATTGGAILATNVSSCNFVYNASTDGTQQSALLWMEVQITQANQTVTLDYGVHVDNAP
jgi:MSHA biogenesis protein MshO